MNPKAVISPHNPDIINDLQIFTVLLEACSYRN